MARLSIHLLGQLQISMDGEVVTGFESDKVRALLVYLAVEAGRLHRREALAELLWPERPEGSALNNLRGALSNLRKAIQDRDASPPFILATRQTIQFNPESDHWLDVSGLAVLGEGAPLSAQALEEAVSLYRGPFLEGFTVRDSAAFEEWASLKREQIGRQIAWACQQLVEQYEQAGATERALGHAWRWAELEPLDELAHRQLMRLLAASGQRPAALAQYETVGRILADELDVQPSEETQALYQALLDGELAGPAPPAPQSQRPASPPVELPVQATPFIGRQRELAQIASLLEDPACRLLTLTGPGGVGKTRLALQAARDAAAAAAPAYADGVFFIPLAPLTSAEFLASTIAAALKFAFYGPDDPHVQLLNHLRKREALLVLDGFEHLLEGVGLVVDLLEHAPRLRLVVTSRERLNLQGEWTVEVGGMAFPGDGADQEIEGYDAVQLFLGCARRVRPDFTLTEVEMPLVVRICQLMLGMPLGIELSATWLRTLSTEQIAGEIESGLEFLSSSLRDVPERHRSLWAAFDHSWKLLAEEEQSVFRKLSVFRGGFDREAAGQIAGASLPVLSALVDKSLVRRSDSGRYEIHELLRQYAMSQLREAGEDEPTHRRHRGWFLGLAERLAPDLWGAAETELLDRMRLERDNYRLALQRSMTWGDAEEALRLAVALVWYWYLRADFSEGRRWLERALEVGKDASPELRALALARAANFAVTQRDSRRGVAVAEEALLLCYETGNLREAGWALYHLGFAAMQQGDFERAAGWYAESADLFRQIGYEEGVTSLLVYQGIVACYQRNYERAAALLNEGLPGLRDLGDVMAVARGLHGLGLTALRQGDFERATIHFEEGLLAAEGIGARLELAQFLEGMAAVLCLQGDYLRSCTLLGASEQLRHTISTPLSTAEQADYERCLSTVRANLGGEAFADLWAKGQAMTLEEAIAYALNR
jgi:predicted ATPase/DNA-binding SARP family transcriptional activator